MVIRHPKDDKIPHLTPLFSHRHYTSRHDIVLRKRGELRGQESDNFSEKILPPVFRAEWKEGRLIPIYDAFDIYEEIYARHQGF